MEEYKIKTVAIVGLGALGILYADHLSRFMKKENLRIIAEEARIERYQKQGVYCNGEKCKFNYVRPQEKGQTVDLILFTVKYQGLQEAIQEVRNQVGDHTIILSALNGISSEEIIGQSYGMDKLLYCVAQGMDAVKEGNQLTYINKGKLVFGQQNDSVPSDKTIAVAEFFDQVKLPYEVDLNMKKRLWGKFMLNVGVNQTVAVIDGTYGDIQKPGAAREKMIGAMKEVLQLSKKEEVNLTEDDLNYWLGILGTLNPDGKPSMRQDLEARRYSEVELFAGTVLNLSKKHGISSPINQELYDTISNIESTYRRYA